MRTASTGSPSQAMRLVLLALVLVGLATGCATNGRPAGRDRLLEAYKSASDHMRQARFAEAKPLLDDAVTTLGGLTSGDRTAKQARNLFRAESSKNFRGEPYERVMAYYYRGILYWMDGEPDNARACFRSAQLQDSDADNEQYQSDYALLDYLDGLVTTKLGGSGADALARAQKNSRFGPLPNYDPKANVLVFFELGSGPTKYASGEYSEELRFRAGQARSASLRLVSNGSSWTARPADDLTFQATTRGGRVMDHVLANKAVFKGSTDSFGNAAILSGAILAGTAGRNTVADEVGAGLLVAGLVGKIISAATTPAADTRAWDNLPNLLGFTALRLPPGQHTLTAQFLDAAGNVTLSRNVSLTVVEGARDTVLFLSDRP